MKKEIKPIQNINDGTDEQMVIFCILPLFSILAHLHNYDSLQDWHFWAKKNA